MERLVDAELGSAKSGDEHFHLGNKVPLGECDRFLNLQNPRPRIEKTPIFRQLIWLDEAGRTPDVPYYGISRSVL